MLLGKSFFLTQVHLLKHLLIAHNSLVSKPFQLWKKKGLWWNEWKCLPCCRLITMDLRACHSSASIRCTEFMLWKLLVYLLLNYVPGQCFLVIATESLSGLSEFIHSVEQQLFPDQGRDETRVCITCKK